jgi:hypothetical protein
MADKLYFSRDSKLYVELTGINGSFQGLWEIPVLDGFSFSQGTNQTEIGLNEMESTAGISRRGRRLFTDSLSPAEWSFSTYMRPTNHGSSKMHLVDQVLWAAMAGADNFAGSGVTGASDTDGNYTRSTNPVAGVGGVSGVVHDEAGATLPSGGTGGLLDFKNSNRATLPKMTLYFVFETDTTNPMVYKLTSAIVNECSIDFDIDGIATANWSGFAKEVTDMQSAGKVITQATTPSVDGDKVFLNSSSDFKLSVPIDADNGGGASPVYDAFRSAIDVGVTSTNNFIRNRLTQLEVRGQNPDVMEGKRLTISGESSGTFTTSAAHGLKVGDTIRMSGITGTDAATFNNLNLFVKTAPSATTFTVSATDGGSALSGTVTTSGSPVVDTGIYNFTLTGGNITISNNVTYLVPEEIGTINKPIEGVTGARGIGGSFTCYLVFDDATGNTGASADFFADLVDPTKGLTKVVNDFDVTFKVGGTVAGEPRVHFNFPKVHIDVPTHNIEDIISLETNFGAYTEDFDTADEFQVEVFGVSA